MHPMNLACWLDTIYCHSRQRHAWQLIDQILISQRRHILTAGASQVGTLQHFPGVLQDTNCLTALVLPGKDLPLIMQCICYMGCHTRSVLAQALSESEGSIWLKSRQGRVDNERNAALRNNICVAVMHEHALFLTRRLQWLS